MRFTQTGLFAVIVGISAVFVFGAMLNPMPSIKSSESARATDKPTFEFSHFAEEHGSRVAVFKFCNPTEKTLYFRGYAEKYPQLFFQRLAADGHWKDSSGLWCATGVGRQEMPAHSSFLVSARFDNVRLSRNDYDDEDTSESPTRIRSGVLCYRTAEGDSTPVWSHPIPFDVAEP
jgi:hypothetical protein